MAEQVSAVHSRDAKCKTRAELSRMERVLEELAEKEGLTTATLSLQAVQAREELAPRKAFKTPYLPLEGPVA